MALEIIKNIATVVGCIISCATLFTLICKPLRSKFVNWIRHTSNISETEKHIQELRKEFTELSSVMQKHLEESSAFQTEIHQNIEWLRTETKHMTDNEVLVLRDRILEKCLGYKQRGYIEERERESLTDMHNSYIKMGGNSYEHIVYEEAMALPPPAETL